MSLVINRIASRVKAPVEQFLHTQAAGGVFLVIAAVIAMAWANIAPHQYEEFWHTSISLGVGFGDYEPLTMSLQHWVNDLLMTFFFMLAGFEIKREIAEGELSDLRRASLPIGAAIGGMLVPALLFYLFNPSGAASSGWGVPMATDIAFAVGILALLGDRVPAAMRILLLALAIIDDLGAILVIAIFYTPDLNLHGLGVCGVGLAVLFAFRYFGVRPGFNYLVPLLIMWMGLHTAGVHATLAGVIVGLSAPTRPFVSPKEFLEVARSSIRRFESLVEEQGVRDDDALVKSFNDMTSAGREAVSPVVRFQTAFHPWVAFVIMPIFAVANAGVPLADINLDFPGATAIIFGIMAGLVVGKLVGVLFASWLLVRLRISRLPVGLGYREIAILGLMAGIGFTMSIFIAALAYKGNADMLGAAKLGILLATLVASLAGLVFGRIFLRANEDPVVSSITNEVAEQSSDF